MERLAICCLLMVASGCRMLGHNAVVSQQVSDCRQLSQQGLAAIEAQRWAEAEGLMAKAVAACPSDVDARRHYAEALWNRGKRAEAAAQLYSAVEQSGQNADARVRLGEMLMAEGQLTAALEQAEAAMQLSPNVAGVWKFRARVLRKKGRLQSALADYQRALSYCPDDREILFETAEVYRQLNKPQEALAVLNVLTDTYPLGEEPKEVVRLQGLALAAQGRFGAAAERFGKIISLDGAAAEDFYSLADLQWRAGSSEQAETAVRRALQLDPNHGRGRELLARLQAGEVPEVLRR